MKQTTCASTTRTRRALTTVAAAVGIGLLAAACTSSGSHSSSGTTTPGSGGGANGSNKCSNGPATGSPLTIAATIINISGGSLSNATVGVPSAQEQENDWTLVANSVNSQGGAGCHKLVMKYYDVNPIDASAAQQVCLNIASDHPFMVLDSGALTEIGASACIPAHQIPLASAYLTGDELKKYSPYYLQIGDIPEDGIRNGVLGLNQLGYFTAAKGFSKLGVVHHDCTPSLYAAQQAALKEAGVPQSQIVTYNLGCPAGQNDTPAAMEQAVLNFKNAHVTNVTEVDLTDFALFTQVAAQQNYKPIYVLSDTAFAAALKQTGTGAVNPANADGAVDVVGGAYGESTTPNFQPTAGTKKCNDIFTTAGQPDVYAQEDGYGGVACNYLWFVQSLVNHAPSATAASLVPAMHTMGTPESSYVFGPVDFSAAPAGSAHGVGYWRPVYYHASCKCFQVPDPTWHQPFP